ncbi:MAG TPA: hypothetical protein VI583_09765 [Cyclobacteriaceae bacterium]|nr:hypothetical protein [Cyclobacteriaceae bacterium]
MTDKHKDIQKLLSSMPDRFYILEEGIDVQTQKEYIDYSHSFDRGELTEKETINLGNILFDTQTKTDAKKKVLTLLAHLGTITAFRLIEKYFRNPDNDLKQWTALALQECKMFLESTLTDQSAGFISSGLGGLNDKLRYFFLVLSSSDQPFTPIQKSIIKEEFNFAAKGLNCIIEAVDQADTYVGLTVLVPMDVAVGIFVETGINKCNELGNFVFEHYYVTNQEIPDKSEIPDIIKKVKE